MPPVWPMARPWLTNTERSALVCDPGLIGVILAGAVLVVTVGAIGWAGDWWSSGSAPPTDPCLQRVAQGAPAGGAAYWLGPVFREAPAESAWGTCDWEHFEDEGTPPWAEIRSHHESSSTRPVTCYPRAPTISVYTVPRGNQTFMHAFVGTKTRLHVNEKQDVIVQFNGRAAVSAELIRTTRAAVQPIPR